MTSKRCFMNSERPCDLTCKAAFEVDDPIDNVDCYFIWLAFHFGEGLFEIKRVVEGMSPPGPAAPGSPPGFPPGFPPGGPGPKPGKGGISDN